MRNWNRVFGLLVLVDRHHVDRAHGIHLLAQISIFMLTHFEFTRRKSFEPFQAHGFDRFVQLVNTRFSQMLQIGIDLRLFDFERVVPVLPRIQQSPCFVPLDFGFVELASHFVEGAAAVMSDCASDADRVLEKGRAS